MRFNKKKGMKFAIATMICSVITAGYFWGRNLISDAGNMEIQIGELTIVVPDNMLCADVNSFLNVRVNPSTDSAVMAKLYPGDAVEYIGESGNWTKVNLDGQVGYVFTKYTVKGTDLKKYIKKHMDKFAIEGTVTKKSFTPVYKEKTLVGSETPAYTVTGKINKKTTVYATKSTSDKNVNETEDVEKCMVIVDGLRFRSQSSTDSTIYNNLYKGTYVDVLSNKNKEWLKIKYNGKQGFIAKQYTKMVTVKVPKSNLLGSLEKGEEITAGEVLQNWVEISYKDKTAYIKRNAVEVSAKLNESDKNVVSLMENNDTCNVLDVQKDAALVKLSNKQKGYINTAAIQAKIDFSKIKVESSAMKNVTRQIVKTNLSSASADRQKLVKFALQYVGNKYVWGGNSLTDGVDCSGFTQQVYLHFGITLNRCSYQQVNNGQEITFDKLQPGDLVFYYDNGLKRIGHVALYIGDGKIVHAQSRKTGIVISNWNYRTPYKAVTILGNK